MRVLPTINHLRTFQVIGHHLNLAQAAQELFLTPSALSYQLGVLEGQLGAKLFKRTGRGLAFTDAGRVLHEDIDGCLNQLWTAVERVSAKQDDAPLIINAPPTFAMRWLLPRFASVQKQFRDAEIRVSTADVNFERDALDCAIAYGDGNWPGVAGDFLRVEPLILVCSPAAVTADCPLRTVADLARYTLLVAKPRPNDWACWFAATGQALPADGRRLMLATRNMIIQATLEGLGVAVVDPIMIHSELSSGRLVRPLPQVARGEGAYHLIYPPGANDKPRVAAFRRWLLEEMHASSDEIDLSQGPVSATDGPNRLAPAQERSPASASHRVRPTHA